VDSAMLKIANFRKLDQGSTLGSVTYLKKQRETDLYVCDIEVSMAPFGKRFQRIRVNHFLTEVVNCVLTITLGSREYRLFMDGFDFHLYVRATDEVRISCVDGDKAVAEVKISLVDFLNSLAILIRDVRSNFDDLHLEKRELSRIRQLLDFGWLVFSAAFPSTTLLSESAPTTVGVKRRIDNDGGRGDS
jgi:hypothetical protein